VPLAAKSARAMKAKSGMSVVARKFASPAALRVREGEVLNQNHTRIMDLMRLRLSEVREKQGLRRIATFTNWTVGVKPGSTCFRIWFNS
jgi:hypothetical protein